MKFWKHYESGIVHLLPIVVLAVLAAGLLVTVKTISNQRSDIRSQAATPISNCWPTSGAQLAGTLAGQPNAIWCYTGYSDGPSTAIKGNNTWVDDFNHGLTLGKFDLTNYTDFPEVGSLCKTQIFRHGNHWMRDVDGAGQGGEGSCAWDFGASAIRPNATFRAENGKLVVEADVATRVADYGGNLFWPEFVITTADRPTGPTSYGGALRRNGTYLYEAFPNHWTLGCRLQNDGGFTCALLDSSEEGDSEARVFELSHFQCGNVPSSHYSTNYQCHSIYGGLPSNLPAADAAFSRDCASLDPDTNCRDRWRWEITNNRLTWFANGKKYMEHTNFDPGARAALDNLLTRPVYVYYGEFMFKLGKPGRMHWDRIAINPKDASGNILPPSAAETFCLGQPNNTCGAGTTPAPTAPTTAAPTASTAPSSTAVPTPTPRPVTTPTLAPTVRPTTPPTPTLAPTTPATPVPGGGLTVTFDNAAGTNTRLNGQYPSGIANWGTGRWFLSAPWLGLTTKSVSFTSSLKSAPITFTQPRRVVSIQAYAAYSATVTLSCAGQPSKRVNVPARVLTTITTGWTGTCTTLNVATSNGWDTNFDNLVLQ